MARKIVRIEVYDFDNMSVVAEHPSAKVLEDLRGAILVSLSEGQEGAQIGALLVMLGLDEGGHIARALAPRETPRALMCAHALATAVVCRRLTAGDDNVEVVCTACGEVQRGVQK